MSRVVHFSVAGLMMLALAPPASAGNIYCSFVGTQQGTFQGTGAVQGSTTLIPVYSLTEAVTVPYDAGTGAKTGKAQFAPLTITKELDNSSPQLFLAAVNGENLRTVTCTLYHSAADGITRAYYKIVLTNAYIVEVKDSGDGVNGTAPGDERERVSFAYEKIQLTDLATGTAVTDNWTPPQ